MLAARAQLERDVSEAAERPLIEVRDLSVIFGRQQVLRNINLAVPRGQTLAVIGESGCGKTVLMKALIGLVNPTRGQVLFDGQDLSTLNDKELTELRTRYGFVFQNAALFDSMTIGQNVAFPLRQHARLPEELIRNIVLPKLQAVGLRGAADLMPAELSGGMARRVALARAIVRDPMLLIYDEPFVGLDPIALNQVLKLIRTLNQTLGLTSIVVAHELAAVSRVADHIYLIAAGKVAAHGAPAEVSRGATDWTRQFFGGEADGPVPFHYPARDYAADLGFPQERA